MFKVPVTADSRDMYVVHDGFRQEFAALPTLG